MNDRNNETSETSEVSQASEASRASSSVRNTLVKLTAIAVALAAFINAGIDVYKSVSKFPRTEAEQTNSDLFKEYFGVAPMQEVPVTVHTDLGDVAMRLCVYHKGDIHVVYGSKSTWFRSPLRKTASLSLTSTAYAQTQATQNPSGPYKVKDEIAGSQMVRQKIYQNGTKETIVTDKNTGDIIRRTGPYQSTSEKGISVDLRQKK